MTLAHKIISRIDPKWIDFCFDTISMCFDIFMKILSPCLIVLACGLIAYVCRLGFFVLLPLRAPEPFTLWWCVYWTVGLFLLMNILFNYFMCVTTNPGTPETPAFEKLVDEFREWIPDRETSSKGAEDEDSNEDSNEEEFEEDGEEDSKVPLRRRRQRRSKPNTRDWLRRGPYEWSRCKNTGVPKPPRSHYCHVRKSIVLNMDHYCPWMFNTVGYLNYRYFVSFLIWLWLGCVFVAFEAGDQVFRKVGIKGGANPQYRHEEQSIMFLFVLCLSVGIAVSILMFWHIYLVLTAQTTIEFYGNFTRRAKWRGETPWRNPYDEGSFKKNWQRVFGRDSRFLGLLPSRREPSGYPWGSSRKGRGSGGSLQMV